MKKICFALMVLVALCLSAPMAHAKAQDPEMTPLKPMMPVGPVIPLASPSNSCTVDENGILIPDGDCDGVADKYDNCDFVLNCDQIDSDQNGIGDACQDFDGDNITDAVYIQDETVNHVDVCDSDTVIIDEDNCPLIYNPGQEDEDEDGYGDLCDDDDGDGFIDIEDNCPDHANTRQQDRDEDGFGDSCDNCEYVYNPDQMDTDDDDVGDACEDDADGDGIPDSVDNCPFTPNPGQEDGDEDFIGDVCDNCPDDPNEDQLDTDEDGVGDVCEPVANTPPAPVEPAPTENPEYVVGELISGSGGLNTKSCQLTPHASASLEGILGLALIAVGCVPLIIQRRRK